MSSVREMTPVDRVVGELRAPPSKSVTNRAFVLAALARGDSVVRHPLVADDSARMQDGLGRLGIELEAVDGGVRVRGCGGRLPASGATLDGGAAGTTVRFLTAAVALGDGEFVIDGDRRMRQRPIGDLLAALEKLGVEARSEHDNDCPPLRIRSRGIPGGRIEVDASRSSQYLSALLMIAPWAAGPLEIAIAGALVSRPYVDITLRMLERFGARCEESGGVFRFDGSGYDGRDYPVEADASNASYFFATAAITGGRVRVHGISRASLQGDVGFVDLLERMGCTVVWGEGWTEVQGAPLRAIEADLVDVPDVAQTLAVTALFADGTTRIRNVANLRIKETDRLAALARELRKLGAEVDELADGIDVTPPANAVGATIDTYDDHRMAMSFALAGLRIPAVRIADPGCVSKSFPGYWDALDALVGS